MATRSVACSMAGHGTFDDAMFDVQVYGGVQIVRSPGKANTPRRLAALWRWSGKDEAASWQSPIPIVPSSDFTTKPPIIFFDEKFRRCGTLMHIDGWGVKYANQALENIDFHELLCVDPERVSSTREKLKALKGFGPKRIQAWEDICIT